MEKTVGHYSFVVGVVLAIVLGLLSAFDMSGAYTPWLAALLVLCGLVVGFLNVTDKETKDFLLVATVLIIAAGIGGAGASIAKLGEPAMIGILGKLVTSIFTQLLAFVVPATVVVALKEVIALSKYG